MPSPTDKSGTKATLAKNSPAQFTRSEEFIALYANSVTLEQSVWDLKMIFGLLSQEGGAVQVEQMCSVTVPWLQAKLLSMFLDMNIAAYEAENGRITIPARMLPVLPPSHAQAKKDPGSKAIAEAVELKLRQRLAEAE